ncbi:MAG: DUF4330 family protein [Clostridia bacterium]|nr:DUF4330 family protein [Clostridia bacterium]
MRKFNRFDIIIAFFIIGALVILGIKVSNFDKPVAQQASTTLKPAMVTIQVDNVRIMTVEGFKVGDMVLSDETNSIIGPIEEIEIEPFKDVVEKSNGEVVLAEVPGKYTVFITVSALMSERETGYFSEGITEIKVNSELKIYTKTVAPLGKVKEIVWQ